MTTPTLLSPENLNLPDNPEDDVTDQEADESAQAEDLPPPYHTDSLTRHGTQPPAYFVARRFQGNIPPPDLLQDYEKALPGLANRLVSQMEANGAHRRYMDKVTLLLRQGRSYLGLGAGLFVVLRFLDVSYRLVTAGHEVAGTVLGTVDLVALAAVFVGMGQTYKAGKSGENSSAQLPKTPSTLKDEPKDEADSTNKDT